MGRLLSRFVALFFILIFIMVASLSACTAAFRNSLINVETYKQTFINQRVYEDLLPYVIPVLLENSQIEQTNNITRAIDLNDINQFMSVDDWRAVSDELIPPEWLKTQAESLLDHINNIQQGNLELHPNIIDLTEVIDRLQGDAARRASQIIIASAPDCTAQQINQLRQLRNEENAIYPICQPPSPLQDTSEQIMLDWFHSFGRTLATASETNANTIMTIPDTTTRFIYHLFQLDEQLSLLLILCPLSLIGLIIIFAVRTFKGFYRWIGWTLIVAGIITMLLLFISQIPVFTSFDEIFNAQSEIERFEAQLYAGFLRSVYINASPTMLMVAGSMIGVGFIMLVLSLFGQSRQVATPDSQSHFNN